MQLKAVAVAILVTLGFAKPLFAQDNINVYSLPDSALAQEFFKNARDFVEAAKYDTAIVLYLKAADIFKPLAKDSNLKSLWEKYITCLDYLGDVNRKKSQHQEGEKYLKKALEIGLQKLGEKNRVVAQAYDDLGILYLVRAKHDEAEKCFQNSLNIYLTLLGEENIHVSFVYSHLGVLYRNKEWLDQALDFYRKALEIELKLFGETKRFIAGRYMSIAVVYADKGDYEHALEYYKKSLAVRERIGAKGESDIAKARTLMNMAAIYTSLKREEEAINCLRAGLKIQNAQPAPNKQNTALFYHNIGFAYYSAGKYLKAIAAFDTSLSIKREVYGESNHRQMGLGYMNIGAAYGQRREFDKANEALKMALKIYSDQLEQNRSSIAETHRLIASTFAKKGYPSRAITHLDSAIYVLQADASSSKLNTQHFQNTLYQLSMSDVLKERGKVYQNWYKQDPTKIENLKNAYDSYKAASELIKLIRMDYKSKESKLHLAEKAKNTYLGSLATGLQLNRVVPDSLLVRELFHISESGKAAILYENFHISKIKSYSGLADSLLDLEKRLTLDLTFYENQLLQEKQRGKQADSTKIDMLTERRFDLKRELDALVERFEKENPRYFNLKYQTKIASVQNVQDALDPQTTLLEYFVSDSSIYFFTITKNRFDLTLASSEPGLEQSIHDLKAAIVKEDYTHYVERAHHLWKFLIEPVKHLLTTENLLIVPDGVLHAVPFAALLTKEIDHQNTFKDYTSLPYLKNKFAISYAYSATLMIETKTTTNEVPQNYYLAFAPVFPKGLPSNTRGMAFVKKNYSPDSTMEVPRTQLLSTRDEVLGIQRVFKKSFGAWGRFEDWLVGKTKIYFENEANEQRVKSGDLQKYRYVHFATHGFANESTPELSGLVFMPDSTSMEDDVLHLNEVYNLALNAELVALSACETGVGKVAMGEGMISLARGFFYAGARNLLVSQWQVNDQSTSQLMIKFYEEMLSGKSKAASLNAAQNYLIRAYPNAYSAPFYWAPYVIIGQ